MAEKKNILVVSAHAADFVWRAGGAIALYASRGYRVRILCLSFGERGESQGAWKQPGMTIERVKEIRRAESTRAAGILGAEIRFFDSGDYPIQPTQETIEAMVAEYRELQPEFVLTHSFLDPYNPDHPTANRITLETRVYAQALRYPSPGKPSTPRPCFSLSRISRNNAISNLRFFWTSHRSGKPSTKPWNRWRRRPISGSITPTWASGAAYRPCGTAAIRRLNMLKHFKESTHRSRTNFHE